MRHCRRAQLPVCGRAPSHRPVGSSQEQHVRRTLARPQESSRQFPFHARVLQHSWQTQHGTACGNKCRDDRWIQIGRRSHQLTSKCSTSWQLSMRRGVSTKAWGMQGPVHHQARQFLRWDRSPTSRADTEQQSARDRRHAPSVLSAASHPANCRFDKYSRLGQHRMLHPGSSARQAGSRQIHGEHACEFQRRATSRPDARAAAADRTTRQGAAWAPNRPWMILGRAGIRVEHTRAPWRRGCTPHSGQRCGLPAEAARCLQDSCYCPCPRTQKATRTSTQVHRHSRPHRRPRRDAYGRCGCAQGWYRPRMLRPPQQKWRESAHCSHFRARGHPRDRPPQSCAPQSVLIAVRVLFVCGHPTQPGALPPQNLQWT
eukprot:Opistho-2@55587